MAYVLKLFQSVWDLKKIDFNLGIERSMPGFQSNHMTPMVGKPL